MNKNPIKSPMPDSKPKPEKPGDKSGTVLGKINDDPKKGGQPARKTSK